MRKKIRKCNGTNTLSAKKWTFVDKHPGTENWVVSPNKKFTLDFIHLGEVNTDRHAVGSLKSKRQWTDQNDGSSGSNFTKRKTYTLPGSRVALRRASSSGFARNHSPGHSRTRVRPYSTRCRLPGRVGVGAESRATAAADEPIDCARRPRVRYACYCRRRFNCLRHVSTA